MQNPKLLIPNLNKILIVEHGLSHLPMLSWIYLGAIT